LLFSLIILQLILPYLGIWILEKEIIFIFTAFVISVPLIVRRYYFSDIGYGIGKIFITVLSLLVAFAAMEDIKYCILYLN
jgi:hypothetical protein